MAISPAAFFFFAAADCSTARPHQVPPRAPLLDCCARFIMADDEAVRNNRLALLNRLRNLFLRVADISLLPTAG